MAVVAPQQSRGMSRLRSKLSLGVLRTKEVSQADDDKVINIHLAPGKGKDYGTGSSDSNKSDTVKPKHNRPPGSYVDASPFTEDIAPASAGIKSLMSRQTFRKALDDPVGLHKFGRFLASELGAESLCFWLNAEQYRLDMIRLQSLGRRIHDLHVPTNAPLAVNISSAERNMLVNDMNSFFSLPDPFGAASEAAFLSMHTDGWHRFVKHRLNLAQNHTLRTVKKSSFLNAFCLAEVTAGSDQPLLMISAGFEQMTGYSLEEAIGRNCRFMQGAGTSKSAIERMRQACRLGTPCQELLLNYHKNGQPMWVLLRIEPLRDETGELRYFMGHQFIISKRASDLTYLLSDDLDDEKSTADGVSPLAALHHQQAQDVTNDYLTAQSARLTVPNSNADRDRRLKDATALAFDAQSLRPRSSQGRAKDSPTQTPSAGHLSAQSPTVSARSKARPTSAGGALSSFGAAAKAERQKLSELTELDAEEDATWQSNALASFVILDAAKYKIMFSSPALPGEYAQHLSFMSQIEKYNSNDVAKQVKKAFAEKESTDITVKLGIWREAQIADSRGQNVYLTIVPLLQKQGKTGHIIVLLAIAS